MYKIILCFAVFAVLFLNSSFALSYEMKKASYPKITQIEQKVFNRNFEKEDIYMRLNRIEASLFGSVNSTMSLADRVDRISARISPSNNNYKRNQPVEEDIYLRYVAESERLLFNQIYDRDDLISRVNRLERSLFGATQNGDIEVRIKNIKMAGRNQNSNFSLPMHVTGAGCSLGGVSSQDFFNEEIQTPQTGVLSQLQALVLPFINSLVNSKVNSYSPYGYGTNPYYNSPYNRYPHPSMYNYNGVNPYSYRNDAINNNFGTRVRIID